MGPSARGVAKGPTERTVEPHCPWTRGDRAAIAAVRDGWALVGLRVIPGIGVIAILDLVGPSKYFGYMYICSSV